MKKTARGALSAALTLCVALSTACTMPGQSVIENTTITVQNDFAAVSNGLVEKPDVASRHVSLPNGLRAVFVSPGTDFAENGSDAASMCADVVSLGMNAVVIESTKDGKAYFDLDLNNVKSDAVSAAVDAAHGANLRAYVTLDANALIKSVIEQGGGLKSGFSAAAHKFAIKYGCEGILITNYYTEDSPEMYAEYLRSGSGIGYENWLYETNQFVLRTISDIIRKTSSTTAVGLMIEDMWANSDGNPEGSETADEIQSLYDGHCDTKKYIENNYADFIIVKAYGSTTDSALNFESVVSWWNELAGDNNLKLYVCHLNERIGEYYGWNEDQLLQQLAVMKEQGGSIAGSAFNSLSSLLANPLQSTNTLKEFFADEINADLTAGDLKMTSPTQLDFATHNSTVRFTGTSDKSFDVLFDGKKISTDSSGGFDFEKELSAGTNYFTIEHKDVKYHYSIERIDDVLKTVNSLGYVTVDDGTTVSFYAVACRGSSVYVSIGDETIALAERDSGENTDIDPHYSEFVGYYTVGGGEIGRAHYLGDVYYYASFDGFNESTWGGNITIASKPEPPVVPDPVISEIVPGKSQLKGIDVSTFQGEIDFNAVKNAGYDFVIIKLGEWNHTIDGFETYYWDAKNAGLHIGFYWFCDGETIEEISWEADACIEALQGLQFDLPIFMDIENQYQFDEGMYFCSEAVRTFCDKLEYSGYNTGLYVSTTWLDNVIDYDIKNSYMIWVADWRGYCGYDGEYGMWQYGVGDVPGIDVPTDLNIMELDKLRPI